MWPKHILCGMEVPLVICIWIELIGGYEFLDRFGRGRAVISAFADKGGCLLCIEGCFVIISWTPYMNLGQNIICLCIITSDFIKCLFGIKGTWGKIGCCRVIYLNHFTKNISCNLIEVRVNTCRIKTGVALIIPCPKYNTRVVSVLSDNIRRFFSHLVIEPFFLRIEVTSHCEVLPYEYTVFVAVIVEVCVLIHITAPASYNVTSAVVNKTECSFISFCIHTVIGRKRYPVCALAVDFDIVDLKCKSSVAVIRSVCPQ